MHFERFPSWLSEQHARQETWVGSLGWEEPLEKEMATHCSILAWEILWTEELGGIQSMGLHKVRYDLVTNKQLLHGFKKEIYLKAEPQGYWVYYSQLS